MALTSELNQVITKRQELIVFVFYTYLLFLGECMVPNKFIKNMLLKTLNLNVSTSPNLVMQN